MVKKDLTAIGEMIYNSLSAKYTAREAVLQLSRQSIRHCANAIRCIHRGEYEQCKSLLVQSKELLDKMKASCNKNDELLYAGSVFDAQKEFAEATITLAIVSGNSIPDPDTLDVGYTAYLNGMGESVGELRRQLLDRIRSGNFDIAEKLLVSMDDIYGVLITIDFPDGMTGGLRRTTDMVRGVLEKSRGDLTIALNQSKLEQRLNSIENINT